MNKMSLLFALLSVYAVHAADKAEEEGQELPMEQISDIYQLCRYNDKVVAITYTSSDQVNSPFRLKDRGDLISLKYGIIAIGKNFWCDFHCIDSHAPTEIKSPVELYVFQKSNLLLSKSFGDCTVSVQVNSNLSDDIKNLLANQLMEECKRETKELIERENIKIRLVNPEERKELLLAVFEDHIECCNLDKNYVLNCLTKD